MRKSKSIAALPLVFVMALMVGSGFADPAHIAPVPAIEQVFADGAAAEPGVQAGPVERLAGPPRLQLRSDPMLSLNFVGVGTAPEGDTPSEVQFSSDGSLIVIAHRDSQNLVVFDADTRAVQQTIPVSGSPNSLALTPDGQYAVTANLFEDTASIVDLVAGVETAVVPVGDQPGTIRVTPDGTTAIVGNTLDSDLSVVDIATATELRQIPNASFVQITSFGSWAVVYKFTDYAITPDSQTVVFPDWSNSRVQFFDIGTGAAVSVATAAKPIKLALTPDGTRAVVAHDYPESRVTLLDVPGQAALKSIASGYSATTAPSVAINNDGSKSILAVSNAVCVVNLVTDAVSAALSTGSPGALLTTFDGQYCVVGNYLGSIVSYASSSILANTLNTTTPDCLAISPVDYRAATAHALRLEFMDVMQANGGAGYQEDYVPTGPPPEGDKARNVAVTPDGTQALVINNHSQNATLIDLGTLSVVGYAPAGVRPGDVAISPTGSQAVIANLDSNFATVVDLPALTTTDITISRRAGQVVISPDGQYAYLAVVADGDGVWRINLNTLAVQGAKVPTGDMGGIGYVFDLASGIALSPDGTTLVTCNSFSHTASGQPDNVSIIDTAAWTEVARVTVGDFPTRAAFSPDGQKIYVSNKNSNTLSVVQNNGASSTVIATIPVDNQPFELTTNPAGDRVYVANFDSRTISVVDTVSHTVITTVPLPLTGGAGQPVGVHVSADGSQLFVAANGADFHVISTVSNAIVATVNTGLAPADLAFSESLRAAVMPGPFGVDGLNVVFVRTPGDLNCDGVVNNADIPAFVLALTDPGAYATAYPTCDVLLGDVSGDGQFNNADIPAFVELLTGG